MIAYQLTQEGYRSRTRCPDEQAEHRRMVPKTACVCGLYRLEHTRPQPETQSRESSGLSSRTPIPAIILMEVAEQTYQKAEERRTGKVSKNVGKYLLSGMMKCSECGASYIISSHRKAEPSTLCLRHPATTKGRVHQQTDAPPARGRTSNHRIHQRNRAGGELPQRLLPACHRSSPIPPKRGQADD